MTSAPLAPRPARHSTDLLEALRTGFRSFREGVHEAIQSFRSDIRADSAHIRGDLVGLRSDIHSLTVRMARIQDSLVGYFTARGPLDSHDNA